MSHKQILRVLAGLIVLICLCAHTAELFDSWDDTLQTGNDTESALVIGVLTIGSAIILAGVIPFQPEGKNARPGLLQPPARIYGSLNQRTELPLSNQEKLPE